MAHLRLCGRSGFLRRLFSTVLRREGDKERVVVLGAGWGGFRVAKDLDKSRFDVTIVSPRNHFLFTPLLPSTTVGTLEFRCVQEPVRTIAGVHYHQARADRIDFHNKVVRCTDVYNHADSGHISFELPYDKLIVAVGTKSNTFGTPGVTSLEEVSSPTGTSRKSVFFLKQLEHARSIRNRIIECFERASSPFVNEEERRRLLTFLVVGGGPTCIEFTSELCDFIQDDVTKWYRDLESDYRVIVVEAGRHLLGSFDISLSNYVERTLKKRRVTLLTNETVKEIKDYCAVLGTSGREVPFGVCVWSTGNSPLEFVKKAQLPHTKDNRISIDKHLKVRGLDGSVYAIGDCASNPEHPLPMLAQAANQQGIHLAKTFNKGQEDKEFRYRFLGMMTSLGTFRGVADFGGAKMKGFTAFLAWRSAYWTMSVSITNKILIPMFWFKSFFFGRDISKF